MKIYERIKARREELGLSVIDVANALGVHRTTVYRYEDKDIEKIPIKSLRTLAKVLRCSPEYLMGWEEKKPEQVDLVTENGTIVEASHGTGKNMDALRTFWEKLNDDGQDEAVRRLEELTELKKYRKEE